MNKAFTLIELMVTLSIVVLMLSGGVPAFNRFNYNNELQRSVDTVVNGINEAKTLALAPSQDKKALYDSYKIEFIKGGYEISVGKWDGNNDLIKNENLGVEKIRTDYLASRVTMSQPDIGKKIIFSITNLGGIIYPQAADISITLNHAKISKSQKIIINSETGQVSIK